METDRNLKLALLALEQNQINVTQFAEACRLWGQRSGVEMADLLVEQGWLRPAAKQRLEALLAEQDCQRTAATQIFLAGDQPDPRETMDHSTGTSAGAAGAAAAAKPTARDPAALAPESRYTIDRLYAEGGIGRIWLAHDVQLNRQVALKMLRPELLGHFRVRSRFLQEAQITGQLEHPGIVPVYELVPHPHSGQVFYAMRFVRGETLEKAAREYHRKRQAGEAKPLGLVSLLSAFVAVCNTVAYAHSRGVIHRDLKGENVLLGDFGEVILLDWGVAKVLDQPEAPAGAESPAAWQPAEAYQTVAGDVVGTPAYMAPEQAEGRLDRIDPRTDLYGLGAILYEILTGQPPFSGTSATQVLRKVLRDKPTPPRQHWPQVPPTLEAICLRALSKSPAERHPSASELAQEVQTWQEVQRREAEEALRRQSAILQSILDTMDESLVVADDRGQLLLVNPAAERMLGAQRDDKTLDAALRYPVLLPDGATPYPRDELPLSRALRGETVDDAELLVVPPGHSSGRWLSANARPLVDSSGDRRGALMVLRDVTERKQAAEALRRSRERFELAVRGSQDGMWDWDLETNDVFYSPRWKSILGYEDHEIAHTLDEWDKRLHPDERQQVLAANYAHINGTTPHYEYEYRLRHKDGSYRWILARGVALRDATGKAYRMAGSHVDITAYKQLEHDLRESEARYRNVVQGAAAEPGR